MVYVVVNQPCCDYPIEVIGVYFSSNEAQAVAYDANLDPSRTHACVQVHQSVLIGNANDQD